MSPAGAAGDDRVYAGLSSAERRADRRERLVQAGLDLFGTIGYDGSSIERLCAQAGVSTRYFYDEFPSREVLLVAVCSALVEEGTRVIDEAAMRPAADRRERYTNVVRAYLTYVTSDERRAQVLHRELPSRSVLEPQRRYASATMTAFMTELFGGPDVVDEETRTLFGLAMHGAAAEVLSQWFARPAPRPPLDLVVEHLVAFCASALPILEVPAPNVIDDRHVG